MRFLFILTIVCLQGFSVQAESQDFNQLISETSFHEKRIHKKLLRSLQNTQIALAYNDRWNDLSNAEQQRNITMNVYLKRVIK